MTARQSGAAADLRIGAEVRANEGGAQSSRRSRASITAAYAATGTPKDGVTVVPDEAAEIASACTAIAGGASLRSIVRDMNTRKVPTTTGKVGGWTSQQLRQTLISPRIAGYTTHKGAIVGTAAWPAIVDDATVAHRRGDPGESGAAHQQRRDRGGQMARLGHLHLRGVRRAQAARGRVRRREAPHLPLRQPRDRQDTPARQPSATGPRRLTSSA